MTTLGHKTTIPVTMTDMLRSCEAVSRGADDALLIGDIHYMSYQPSNQVAIENAGDFIKAGMDMVKVEGAMTDRIKAICDSGILVMSHLGLTPHTRAKLGGYKVQGKTAEQAEIVLNQAFFLQGMSMGTPPAHASILYATTPVFVLIISIILKE